ncbi:MAG: T9SS type A sorting domain-containing protein [Bacteroidota bacterium]
MRTSIPIISFPPQGGSMNRIATIFSLITIVLSVPLDAQNITLQPQAGQMACAVRVPGLPRQSFILGLPETIGSSEGMILNFPEVNIQWEGPDAGGAVRHTWTSPGKVEYTLVLVPSTDYVDAVMTVRNLGRNSWTNVFSFNCLNPAGAQPFQDWTLERTYMSKNGQPFRMDGTSRVNNGSMPTVQFYLNADYGPISPFIQGFQSTSPDKTDDSYIVTLSEDGLSYMAATSPKSCFLFDNLDRCCIHSGADFGNILPGGESTVTCRFYFAMGGLEDFVDRFDREVKNETPTTSRVAMCYGGPWVLADTAQWSEVLGKLDILKIYIGDINERVDPQQARALVSALLAHDIKIAIELGGLLDWHASKGDQTAQASFQQEFASVKPLIELIKSIDPARSIDMLDMDGPIRRMLFPNNAKADYHTLASAVTELSKVVQLWRDSVPGIEINLLTNFPNWAWGATPAYFAIDGESDGYGRYLDVLDAINAEKVKSGLYFDGLTIDNPYDYATGTAQSNQTTLIAGVDWMQRIAELDEKAKSMGMKVNMIFNTNGGRTAAGYSEQTLELIDLYHQRAGKPDGYWIQSWYQLPGAWLPESDAYTMTNLVREAMKKVSGEVATDSSRALLEPADGRVYHGVQTMTFEPAGDPVAGYLSALNGEDIQPAVRGMFFSIPGTRGTALSLRQLGEFYRSADSIGFIPELSLFLVSDVATDSVIAVSNQYDAVLDSIVTLSIAYGKAMFLRIGGEFNGVGEGWNGGGYHPYLYVDMFRKITDKFSSRGFRDSVATIWCYYPAAANDFDSTNARGALWYPGDEYVDWFGLDLFDPQDFDLSLPDYDRRGITRKGKSERFLAMARSKGKPVYMSETSAKGINISADAADSQSDWDNWFAKFFDFITAHTEIKGYSYIDANWPVNAYAGWGDARIQNSPGLSAWYRGEMHKPKYIHLPASGPTGVAETNPAARSIRLHSNYPNPFNPSTTIRFELPRSMQVTLVISDALGRDVRRIINGQIHAAGEHTVVFDASALPSGVYNYRLIADGAVKIKRMLLLR